MQRLHLSSFFGSTALLVFFTALTIAQDSPKQAANETVPATKGQRPLKKGDAVGAFYVTKVAGAEEDGVEPGQELCYRCRFGSRPMVMVFARETGGKMSELVRELDKALDENKESQLRGLVTMMGEDAAVVKGNATKVAEKSGAKIVPVVVAKETEHGPENYKLSKTADVTIVVATDSQVVSTHVFNANKIDVAMVMNDVKRLLN